MNSFQLCQKIAEDLQVPYALLASLAEASSPYFVESLCYYEKGNEGKAFSYCPDVAPCFVVYEKGEYRSQGNLMKAFPNDRAIQKMKLQFYCGVRIDDEKGRPLGHLAIFDVCDHRISPQDLRPFEKEAREIFESGKLGDGVDLNQ